jgi:ribosomal protein L13E
MVKHNNVIPNNHFKKKWQFYVKTWFNQPARKVRRRQGAQGQKHNTQRPAGEARGVPAGPDSCCHMCFCPAARADKAKKLFPRPAAGLLRPVVRGQTLKYNSKQRLGKGFTLDELKVRSELGWKLCIISTGLQLSCGACRLPRAPAAGATDAHVLSVFACAFVASVWTRCQLICNRRNAIHSPLALGWVCARPTVRPASSVPQVCRCCCCC